VLVDGFGRIARDLRVSVTDRCNLRCTYCMPAEGLSWIPRPDLLSDDEIIQVIAVATRLGVREVRFTGGEPLLRPGLPALVERTRALPEAPEVSVTTNGIGLAVLAPTLAAAGLTRVNVSLDTLDKERFVRLARRDRLDDVIAGLHAAHAAGLRPVKVNAVLMRGVNDDEAPALLRFCLEHGFRLRIIEQMPLDAQHGWDRATMVTAEETLQRLQAEFALVPVDSHFRGSAPAEEFVVDGGGPDGSWSVGVIASVTRPFCSACDRLRLTADGQVRNCLFSRTEADLREVLRSGAPRDVVDRRVADVLTGEVARKKAGHGIGEPGFEQPDRPMSAIGG
jgi:cyclic pyranopterin phosphate synthase